MNKAEQRSTLRLSWCLVHQKWFHSVLEATSSEHEVSESVRRSSWSSSNLEKFGISSEELEVLDRCLVSILAPWKFIRSRIAQTPLSNSRGTQKLFPGSWVRGKCTYFLFSLEVRYLVWRLWDFEMYWSTKVIFGGGRYRSHWHIRRSGSQKVSRGNERRESTTWVGAAHILLRDEREKHSAYGTIYRGSMDWTNNQVIPCITNSQTIW